MRTVRGAHDLQLCSSSATLVIRNGLLNGAVNAILANSSAHVLRWRGSALGRRLQVLLDDRRHRPIAGMISNRSSGGGGGGKGKRAAGLLEIEVLRIELRGRATGEPLPHDVSLRLGCRFVSRNGPGMVNLQKALEAGVEHAGNGRVKVVLENHWEVGDRDSDGAGSLRIVMMLDNGVLRS